jgi:hypothetical protein
LIPPRVERGSPGSQRRSLIADRTTSGSCAGAHHPPGLPGVASPDHDDAKTHLRAPLGTRETASRAPGLRGFAATRGSVHRNTAAEPRVQSVALDAVSMATESAFLASITPGNPRGRCAPPRVEAARPSLLQSFVTAGHLNARATFARASVEVACKSSMKRPSTVNPFTSACPTIAS